MSVLVRCCNCEYWKTLETAPHETYFPLVEYDNLPKIGFLFVSEYTKDLMVQFENTMPVPCEGRADVWKPLDIPKTPKPP